MTTAREFVKACGLEDNEKNLYGLTNFLDSSIDYSQFPDVEIDIDSVNHADFQEYMEQEKDNAE